MQLVANPRSRASDKLSTAPWAGEKSSAARLRRALTFTISNSCALTFSMNQTSLSSFDVAPLPAEEKRLASSSSSFERSSRIDVKSAP